MKKVLIILIAIGFILSCKLLDKVDEQKADVIITLDYSQINKKPEINKVNSSQANAASIDVVSVVIFKIDYSYSSIRRYQADINIQTDADNWTGYWIPYIQGQLNDISGNNCTIEESSNLSLAGSSATGQFSLEPGVYNILVGLFENNHLLYVGTSHIIDLNTGDSKIIKIDISCTALIKPTLVTPSNGAENVSLAPLTFDWTDVPGVTHYLLIMDSDLSNVGVALITTTNQSSFSGNYNSYNLWKGVKYYWWVIAYNSCGEEISSDTLSFTTEEDCPSLDKPTLVSPSDGAVNVSLAPLSFDWNDVPGATHYLLIMDSDLSNVGVALGTTTTQSSFSDNFDNYDLWKGVKYYWWVIAYNSCGDEFSSDTLSFTTEQPAKVVTFPDPNFEAVIRETLNKSGGDITNIDLESITQLDGRSRNISDISGIEYCTNLVLLEFMDNQISDISMISNLINLIHLGLMINQISDISYLSSLSNLNYIFLGVNQISDISVFSSLINLDECDLSYNQIVDIYPLIQNSGINSGDEVYLRNNPLNNVSIYEYIPQLQGRGVTVEYNEPETVTDIDGNVYKTVTIGDQIWMAENLKVTQYRNGDPIQNITDYTEWPNITTGSYCNYDNDENYGGTYGKLYNWYAVTDTRKLAPEGWHVPSDTDWKQLEMYLGMSQIETDNTGWRGTDEGGKLKETGTTHWYSPNTVATNVSGFTALPGGSLFKTDVVAINTYNMGFNASLWSSTAYDSYNAWIRLMGWNTSKVYRVFNTKYVGNSLRCIKD